MIAIIFVVMASVVFPVLLKLTLDGPQGFVRLFKAISGRRRR